MRKKTGTGGRRTILQLSPPGLRSGTIGETSGSDQEQETICDGHKLIREESTNMRNPTVKATEGLSLLGAYEDSDDEDTDYQPKSGRSQHNQSTDIDSTLANFMAEIDAITTQPVSEEPSVDPQAPAPIPPRPEPKALQAGTDSAADQNNTRADFQYNTQCSLAGVGVDMGDWQEVWDENTSCYYYWNTLTNEVAWELPHYLADQVQGLQHYADSTTVNGNGTCPSAVYYPEQSTATLSVMASKKETKKKEVMESVLALTSEEEEHRGVAATLLAPLIPPEVKEEEDTWRKRLLGGLDEHNSLDSDGEKAGHPESPAAPLRDLDPSCSLSQREQRSRNQSQENSDAEEEEPEEDTMELELALERKRAELRALEEGDGSGGGSSPCSEASLEPSNPRCLLQKKARWKTSFLRTASPDSNSRDSDAQDKPETTHSKALEKPRGPDDQQAAKGEQETASKVTPKEEVETPELKFQIGELANTLTSKMEFLGINRKAISNFQLLLLQTEMRIADWREGALNGLYLRRRLQEAAEHIKQYELTAAPKGWSCHWDREHRRYFYVNDRTGASQWDFPNKEEDLKGGPPPQSQGSSGDEPAPPALAPSAGIAGSSTFTPMPPPEPTLWSAPQPPLPPDQPPPPADYPPPPPPPPESPPPPPPPPDSDDGEIMEVEMEDDEGEPPAPGTEEDGSLRPPLPPGSSSTKNVESSVSLVKGHKRKAAGSGLPSKAVTIGSSPILYSQTSASAAPVLCGSAYWGVPVVAAPSLPAETLAPPLPPPPTQPPLPTSQPPSDPPGAKMVPTDKTKKLKKEKTKKSKTKMPSLVKKWQSIQKELDEEEKSSSSDEDRDQLNKRGIEEWKQQQLLTGKAGKNANFEALPEDWRERMLKKRKMMKSK